MTHGAPCVHAELGEGRPLLLAQAVARLMRQSRLAPVPQALSPHDRQQILHPVGTDPVRVTDITYVRLLTAHDVLQSVTRPGKCYDNAVVVSIFATLKAELIHRTNRSPRERTRLAIFEYVEAF